MTTPQRTIGQTLSGTDLPTAAMFAGLALVVIGSLGPWATTPFGSASGIDGDGVLALVLAVIAAVLLVRNHRLWAGIACVLILAIGVYDAVDIQSAVSKVTLFGTQVAHVGWGVYAVIAGAVVVLVTMLTQRRSATG